MLPVANLVTATDTFNAWLTRTNQIAYAMSTEVVTANSTLGSTTGNAHIDGRLSANTLVATQALRGGNNSTSNTLVITSNVNANGTLFVANTITANGLATFSAGINSTSLDLSGDIAVGDTVVVNTSIIQIGNSTTNAHMTANSIGVGNVYMNATTITIGATTINSTTLGESSNNSNYLDQHTWESPKEIGGVDANSAYFTTINVDKISVDKISANGELGSTGEILKANSTGGIFWSTGGEGYTGSVGPIGFTGSAGAPGSSGTNGYTGSLGGTGYTGSRGSDGTPGDQGYTGSVGNDGSPGGRGYTGSASTVAGPSGYTGSLGPIGFTGSAGTALNGYTGSKGYTGSAGTAGATGYTGSAFGSGSNAQVNSLGVGTPASGTAGEIRATNEITAFYSDMRLKTKIGNIQNALEKVLSLNGFYFRPNDKAQNLGYEDKIHIGVSAQEVLEVLPEIVVPAPIDEEYMTVHYDKLVPLLIEAIKELYFLITYGGANAVR